MQRILITSCSQRKKTDKNLLPAIERYDGPNFRLIRKYLRQSKNNLNVYILSAKYGLLSQEKEIPFYEEKLKRQQSQRLTELSISQVDYIIPKTKKEVFINLGNLYLQVFEPILDKLSQTSSIVFASGSSGKRLAEMYDWLYGEKSPLRNEPKETELKEVYIQGIRLQTNEKQIRSIIQNEIAQNGVKDLQNFQSWYIPIDELKISPKWLVSQLTGLPVGKFHSGQARRALQKLGIKVQRV